jgi:hypothetical protein
MHLAFVGFAANALHQLAALQPVHDGGRGGLAHVGVIRQLARGDLAKLVDPLSSRSWGEVRPASLIKRLECMSMARMIWRSDQHFIMFFHGVWAYHRAVESAKFSA